MKWWVLKLERMSVHPVGPEKFVGDINGRHSLMAYQLCRWYHTVTCIHGPSVHCSPLCGCSGVLITTVWYHNQCIYITRAITHGILSIEMVDSVFGKSRNRQIWVFCLYRYLFTSIAPLVGGLKLYLATHPRKQKLAVTITVKIISMFGSLKKNFPPITMP